VNTYKKLKIIKREISPFISRYIKTICQESKVKTVQKKQKAQDLHVFGAFVSFVLLAVIGDFLELFLTKLKVKYAVLTHCAN
jgi:hypothetical protein